MFTRLPSTVPLPRVPEEFTGGLSTAFREWLGRVLRFLHDIVRGVAADLELVHARVNTLVSEVGDDLPVAGDPGNTLAIRSPIHRVTAGAFNTISVPSGFSGPIMLIPLTAFVLNTGVNIAIAATAVVGQAMVLVYVPVSAKWYPSYTTGIEGGGGAAVGSAQFHGPTELVGTKNGANTVFTAPFEILIDTDSKPVCGPLIWKRGVQHYTGTNPPAPGRWTLTGTGAGQQIIVGDPPMTGDYLALAQAIEAV